MSAATLRLIVPPRRMLPKREAAEYCGLTAKRFEAECRVAPVAMPGGTIVYDMRDLDAWIDSLKSGAGDADDDILGRLA